MNRMEIALLGEGKVTFSKAEHRDVTALISTERLWKRKEMHCREMLGFAEVWSSKEKRRNEKA